jgi:uncharacterized protein (TIGR02594 family)
MEITAYSLAERFVGLKEAKGPTSNSHVLAMLQLDAGWVVDDSTPWCSAFLNYVAWLLRLPRSKNLAARSWLTVGTPVPIEQARPGFDVVILKRGGGDQPGVEVLEAPGHVALFSGLEGDTVFCLGGNQGDQVSVVGYPVNRLLGIRRLRA